MEFPVNKLLQKPIVVINLGLAKFAKSLDEQKVKVIQVDWVPPAGGDKEMIDLLDALLEKICLCIRMYHSTHGS
jgi:hypothetical protein